MTKDIFKYMFVDVIHFLLFIVGFIPLFLSVRYLPKIYYLNFIVAGIYILILFKLYFPWERTVEKSLFTTLNLDSSKKFSFMFYLMMVVLSILGLIKGEYLLSGLMILIILIGIYVHRKKPKPTIAEEKIIEVEASEVDGIPINKEENDRQTKT